MRGLDPDWLHQRYVRDKSTVATIAAEAGVDPSNVHRALRRAGIPPRGAAGRRQWRDVLTRHYLETKLAAGTPIRSIAEEVGCDPSQVRRWMLRHGLREEDVTATEARQLKRMYQKDRLSVTEIARQLGIATVTARARLVAAEVDIRPPGRPRR